MRKVFLSATIAVGLLATVSCSSDDDNNKNHPDYDHKITPQELPEAARAFVTANFPDAQYQLTEKQNAADSDGSIYEVLLSNRFEIDFDIDGNWIDIDGNNQPIPPTLIPAKIKDYITANYTSHNAVKFDREKSHIKIELSNDIDLIFDLEGNFLRID